MKNGPRWSELLRDLLSTRAIDILERADLRRDPTLSCDPEKLREVLLDRGLPVYDAVLEYERRIGSVLETIGLFDRCTRRRAPLTPDNLPRYGDRILFPIGLWIDPYYRQEPDDDIYDYLMDAEGTCYLRDREDSAIRAISERHVALIERYAFGWDFHRTARPHESSSRWRHEVEAYPQSLAARVAESVHAAPFPPATDRYGGVWAGNDVVIQCASHANTVRAQLAHFEDAVRVIQAVYAARPKAVVTWSSHDYGSPPEPDEPIAHSLPAYGYQGRDDGEFLIIGTKGKYRLHRTKKRA
jgi:hypothetical protein